MVHMAFCSSRAAGLVRGLRVVKPASSPAMTPQLYTTSYGEASFDATSVASCSSSPLSPWRPRGSCSSRSCSAPRASRSTHHLALLHSAMLPLLPARALDLGRAAQTGRSREALTGLLCVRENDSALVQFTGGVKEDYRMKLFAKTIPVLDFGDTDKSSRMKAPVACHRTNGRNRCPPKSTTGSPSRRGGQPDGSGVHRE